MKPIVIITLLILLLGVSLVSYTSSSPKKKRMAKTARRIGYSVPADSTYKVVIDKSDYELRVYDREGWLATYPVVFGNDDLADKKMAGDRRTPEGSFRIIAKKPHNKWQRFLLLDYPNPESLARFNERKMRGEIPKNAQPGGGIGIHGTLEKENWSVDYFFNWTNGCISLHKEDIIELYETLPVGTLVVIQK